MADKKQYFRDIKPGDVSVEGRQSNGFTADKKGNVIFYSGLKDSELDYLDQIQNKDNIPLYYGNSYFGVIKSEVHETLALGNNNYETLNEKVDDPKKIVTVNNPQPTPTPQPSQTILTTPLPSPTPIPTKEDKLSDPAPSVDDRENEDFIFLEDQEFQIDPTQLTDYIDTTLNDNELLTDLDILQINIDEKVSKEGIIKDAPRSQNNQPSSQNNQPKTPAKPVVTNNNTKTGTLLSLVQNNSTYGNLGDAVYYPTPLYNQGDSSWGSLQSTHYKTVKGKKVAYTLKQSSHGCCYNTVCMILGNATKDANSYSPLKIWNSGGKNVKSVLVHFSDLASVANKTVTLVEGSLSKIDEALKTKPVGFEWSNKAWAKGYNLYHGVKKGKYTGSSKGISYTCCNQHWMVITGKNKDGTYTVFDPAGGLIRKNQTRDQIEAGLERIIYVN